MLKQYARLLERKNFNFRKLRVFFVPPARERFGNERKFGNFILAAFHRDLNLKDIRGVQGGYRSGNEGMRVSRSEVKFSR